MDNNVIPFPRREDPAPPLTILEKESLRVLILTEYLDKTDPNWRSKITEISDLA